MNINSKLVVLSSGGTGGHMFPAQSLAEELSARGFRLAFITDRRGESYRAPVEGVDTHFIKAAGVSGRNPLSKAVAAFKLGIGYLQARRLLRELAPAVVVGFGGYPTIPTLLAASHLKIKTVIHEQNAVLGRANRFLAPSASRIATAFKTTGFLRNADRSRVVWTGNPVRREFVAIRDLPYPALSDDSPVEILVVGGSQGARIFGKIVPGALSRLSPRIRNRIHVTQQCRPEDIASVRETYAENQIKADLKEFFDDVPKRLAAAHLVICRAGASTMAEITTAGKPAILVPYPHAIDDHQTVNAARLCDAGGGWLFPDDDFTSATLGLRIESLVSEPKTLEAAARCVAQLGMPEAASRLAEVIVGVIENGCHPQPADIVQGAPA